MPINNEAIDIEEDEIPEGLDELLDETLTAMEIQDKLEEKEKAKKFVSKSFTAPSLKAKPKVKRAKIKSNKLLGKDTNDLKGVESDEKLVGGINDNLTRVSESLGAIEQVLRQQFGLEKSESDKDRRSESLDKAKEREEKLEGKKTVQKDRRNALKAIKPPAIGFFDTLKNYFKNILVGSALLAIVNWLKNPDNQQKIEDFKNFMIDKIPLILGGLALIAAIPIASTLLSLTGVLAGGLPILAKLLGFVATPVGLAALAFALGIGGTLFLMKKGVDAGRNLATGGQAFTEAQDVLNNRLFAAGMNVSGGNVSDLRSDQIQKGKGSGRRGNRTPEQEKIYQEVEEGRAALNKLRDAMRAEMDQSVENLEPDAVRTVKQKEGRGARTGPAVSTPYVSDELKQKTKDEVRLKYEAQIPAITGTIETPDTGSNVFDNILKKIDSLEDQLNNSGAQSSTSINITPPQRSSPEVSFLPINSTPTPPTSSAAATQTSVAVFSANDSNSPYSMAVRSIYNMVNA